MKLFGRDDEAYASAKQNEESNVRTRPQPRPNEQGAILREVHAELDEIDEQISALRERQAASVLRARAPKAPSAQVQTLDLRTLDDVAITNVVSNRESFEAAATTATDDGRDADFERRFQAFAAGENDDPSRRWLDTA